MHQRNYQAILEKCQKLTENGERLMVSWNGGGDEGFFELRLDDNMLEDDYGKEDSIIDLVEEHLGYGGFSGSFNVSGEVEYDREEYCFTGTDDYNESESATCGCDIKITVPEGLWFDSLAVDISMNVEDLLSV